MQPVSLNASPTPLTSGSRRLILSTVFLSSGFAALIYQSVWSKYLGLILGHAAYAQALVLGVFMGGMALGSWLSTRWVVRVRRPLLAYALIEGLIGLLALLFDPAFGVLRGALYDTLLPGLGGGALAETVRWSLSTALILPQCILLGMTFPFMAATVLRRDPAAAGALLGWIYFINSIGAAIGALASTFLIVPSIGLPGALMVAAIINLAIFVITAVMGRGPHLAQPEAATPQQGSTKLIRLVIATAFITGATSFMYEIGWVRMLALVLGGSNHAFEIMIAAFIAGLACGGLWVRKHLQGPGKAWRMVAYAQVLMGIAAILGAMLYSQTFHWISWLLQALARSDGGYLLYNIATAAVSLAVMFPAAFFAGMTLPALTCALLEENVGERAVGRVYAANTLGCILGVFLMMHVILPALGLKLSMLLAAALDIALGVVLIRARPDLLRRHAPWLVGAGVLVLVGGVLFANFDVRRLASGVYRTGSAEVYDDVQMLYFKDGKTASISLAGTNAGRLMISTNGKIDASINVKPGGLPTNDEPTMILAALLGDIYSPKLERVAVIGFGSGLTTHSLLASPRPAAVETIEIEANMIEAARGFGPSVSRAYTDRRSRIIIDDAKAHFSRGSQPYDLIVSEPSNPWVSGVANLFSHEFYHFIKRYLTPEGILVQWVQVYEMDDRRVISILKALDQEFAHYRIYMSNDADLLIIASAEKPLHADPARLEHEAVLGMLARIGMDEPEDVGRAFVYEDREVRAMLKVMDVPANSDFQPYVGHHAPADRFRGAGASFMKGIAIGPAGLVGRWLAHWNLDSEIPLDTWVSSPPAVASRSATALATVLHDSTADVPDILDVELVGLYRNAMSNCFAGYTDAARAGVLLDLLHDLSLSRPALNRAIWQQLHTQCAEGWGESGASAVVALALALNDGDWNIVLEHARDLEPVAGTLRLSLIKSLQVFALASMGQTDEAVQIAEQARLPLEARQHVLFLAHSGGARQEQ